MRHSIEVRDRIFVKDYGLLSSARNMNENICKNVNAIYIVKYALIMLNNLLQVYLKLLIRKS